MNSEIPSVLKLSPVTVGKAGNKKTEELDASVVKGETGIRESVTSVTQDDQHGKSKPAASPELVKLAADQGNNLLQAANRNLQFKVDDETKELVVKVVDSDSGEVVRQIPAEEMLAFIKRMQELEGQQGSVLQDRA
ncbi:flagellar protein FlaG [Methylomonas montana]|uniref:flagellar protein FlaG n=1 Tax=Methylomonas montana TaxID=3058963 RepID=UPI00265B4CB3|nr:flagellar protein FlaG [Methylomonas montana]WKJ89673.1 flagellar protein FlaG [Methylomonas montana]